MVVKEIEGLVMEMEATARVEPMAVGEWDGATRVTIGEHQLIVAEREGRVYMIVRRKIGSKPYTVAEILMTPGSYKEMAQLMVSGCVALANMRYTVAR